MGSLIDEFENILWQENHSVCGIDEAGRGPMAGPCVVSGVIFPKNYYHADINDSKKLSPKKRDELVSLIKEHALWYKVVVVDVDQIDLHNIYRATQMAMEEIANSAPASYILTDAMPLLDSRQPFESIVKGDSRSMSIAAASVLAKTYRDALMVELDRMYPEYGFAKHKGYGTKAHREAILKYGRTKHHRKTFKFKDEDQISLDI